MLLIIKRLSVPKSKGDERLQKEGWFLLSIYIFYESFYLVEKMAKLLQLNVQQQTQPLQLPLPRAEVAGAINLQLLLITILNYLLLLIRNYFNFKTKSNFRKLMFCIFSELKALYEQYKDSRSRYHYFREKLQKEMSLQPAATPPVGAVGRVDLTRTVQAPVPVSYAAPIPTATPKPSYPGAQQTPAYPTQSYRPSNYPGATPAAAVPAPTAYPGAQASVYTAQQTAFVFNCCQRQSDRELSEKRVRVIFSFFITFLFYSCQLKHAFL